MPLTCPGNDDGCDIINQNSVVEDGDQINVPETEPTPSPAPTSVPTATLGPGIPSPTAGPSPSPVGPATTSGKININTATAAELDTLPGIGPAFAQRIIDYRTEHGRFTSIEQIMNVSGIGPATFDKIKDLITVN